MQILIVEDDFISRRLLSRYLSVLGDCDLAVNGEEALAAVRAALESGEHYDLVCLDIMMPGIDGHEVLAGIRALEDRHGLDGDRRCRVVMTTALEEKHQDQDPDGPQPDDYMVKPIVRRNFLEVIERLGFAVPTE